MALAPKFTIQEFADSSGFYFLDTTGDYDASTNTGGWGGINTAYAGANYAEITLRDHAGTVIGAADTEFPYSDFDSTRKIIILPSYYGLTMFNDGIYQIDYTVRTSSGGSIVGAYSAKFLLFAQVNANLKRAFLELSDQTCSCPDKFLLKIMKYVGLLYGVRYETIESAYDKAQANITKLLQDSANICIDC